MEVIATGAATDDRLLLDALRRGQSRAFEELMHRFNRRLFRAARGVVPDDAEAQDVVQEAYLRAFVALHSFRGDSSLATWLTRIVINQALSQQRKLGRMVPWNEDGVPEEGDMPALDDDRCPEADSPEEELARGQLRRRLQQAIDRLPPIYRIVMILRAVEGLTVEETALALQVSGDVVKTRYLRARAMLRSDLTPQAERQACMVHDFKGQRCDDTVAAVMAKLRACGVIRDH